MENINHTIEELINIIISEREKRDKELCCYPSSYYDGSCIHDCGKCKEDYYKKMKDDMVKKYGINE